ncbi:terminase [Aerococcaceae bacterium WGS1372]
MLTPKQEKYVQGLVAGLSQRQAYYEAFPNSKKWKPETVDNKASKLFKENEVLARYNELIEEHKGKALWTREEAVKELKWLYKQAIKSIEEQDEGYVRQGTSSALLGAIQELNKLEDLYPSDKHQVEHIGQVSFVDDIS